MEYTQEQRELIRRIDEISAQMEVAAADNNITLERTGDRFIDAAQTLSASIQQSRDVTILFNRWGDRSANYTL